MSAVYGVFRSEEDRSLLHGPIGVVPKDHEDRIAHVRVPSKSIEALKASGQRLRPFLPSNCKIVRSTFDTIAREWVIVFHLPTLRQLSSGELIPRWTHKFRDDEDQVGWWEEVSS